jgi:hypothetical protein
MLIQQEWVSARITNVSINCVNFFKEFEVFTALTMKNAVFWDMMPFEFVINGRFGRTLVL